MPNSLFAPAIPDGKAHPSFLAVRDHPAYQGGRHLMDETFAAFGDQDGNFVKDFQGPGFSARTWELSLYAYLQEVELALASSGGTPDYVIDGPSRFAVEATTTQQSRGGSVPLPSGMLPQVPDDLDKAQAQFVFQIGKALRNKLLKRFADGSAYWELPHTKDLPFLLAVEAFHAESSLFHSVSFAAEYLYGVHATGEHDAEGKLTITNSPIAGHTYENKTIPSGLFQLPEAAHLCAVLFSNSGTAAQFNRIGAQRGYGDSSTRIVRVGTCADPDPDASLPALFGYVVGDGLHCETFAEAMHVLHNPNAAVPLPKAALPKAAEWSVEDGSLSTTHYGFSALGGLTSVYHGPGADVVAKQTVEAFLS
jgi:hypothetical protein